MIAAAIFVVLTWLVAGVPFGLVVTTLWGPGVDLRAQGSGNVGATNVLRVAGPRLAAAALALDVGKGLLPVLVAAVAWPEWGMTWWTVVGLTAFAGHCWPVYLEFRGGKGVATSAGVMLGVSPWVACFAALVWGAVVAATGRSSVASLSAAAASVLAALVIDRPALLLAVPLALLVTVTHRSNLGRLWEGDEAPVLPPASAGRPAPITAEEALEQGPGGHGTGTGY